MSSESKSTSFETEPLVFFHPTLAGTAPPGRIQPLPGPMLLEEEPATWAQLEQAVREALSRS